MNAAVLNHVSQTYYSSPNALYFANYAPTTPQKPTPKSTNNTEPTQTNTEPAAPTGLALSDVVLTPNLKQSHPNLEKLFDDAYVRKVVETVRERLHIVGDIGALSLPFFAEPEFASPTVTSLAAKVWSPSLHPIIASLAGMIIKPTRMLVTNF